jgi:hypothetical protein
LLHRLGNNLLSFPVCLFPCFYLDTLCLFARFDYGILSKSYQGIEVFQFPGVLVVLIDQAANKGEYVSLI